MNLELHEANFQSLQQFKELFTNPNDRLIAETVNGVRKEQTVPVIYLEKGCIDELTGEIRVSNRKQKFVEFDSNIDDALVYPGLSFKIMSFEEKITFTMEQGNSVLARSYDPLKCKYYLFKTITRENLIGYNKVGAAKFYGVKAKNSVQFAQHTKRATRGLIGMALQAGISKGFGKIEDDIELREGFKYELKYIDNSIEKTTVILCDNVYALQFERFLDYNWKKDKPAMIERKKSSGCFIATATMGSYNHFVVLDLRSFRDNFLTKKSWGRKFIQLYYKHSPKYADIIRERWFTRIICYAFIVKPIHYVARFLNR